MSVATVSPKNIGKWQFGARKALVGGGYAGQRLRSWSSFTSLVAEWLQPSSPPVSLQNGRYGPSYCCNLLSVELVLTDLEALNRL